MAAGTVHVVGAGLAGLSAAVRAGGAPGGGSCVHEAARAPAGAAAPTTTANWAAGSTTATTCCCPATVRPWPTSARSARRGYADRPPEPRFPFVDLATGERWTLRPGLGRLPWWVLDARAARAGQPAPPTISASCGSRSQGRRRPWRRCSTPRARCSAACWRAARGRGAQHRARDGLGARLAGRSCRDLRPGRGRLPAAGGARRAVGELRRSGAAALARTRACGDPVRRTGCARLELGGRARDGPGLRGRRGRDSGLGTAWCSRAALVAADLLPGLRRRSEFRAILNLHFRSSAAARAAPASSGLSAALAEWVFASAEHVSVTISAADRLVEQAAERAGAPSLARRARGARPVAGPDAALARRQGEAGDLRRDARAGAARRPAPRTRWRNLVLAGDWTATGLPATIEGAIRSGQRGGGAGPCDGRCARGARYENAVAHRLTRDALALKRPSSTTRAGDALDRRIERRPSAARPAARRRPLGVRAGGGRDHPGRIRAAGAYPRPRSTRRWRRRSASICARIQGAHGGWPLFHDGAFDISRQREGLFRAEGDRRRPGRAAHGARARGDPGRRRGGAQQRLHPRAARAVRPGAVARGAGDAGRDHAPAAVVPVPPRQGLVLVAHRDRAAARADGAEARARAIRATSRMPELFRTPPEQVRDWITRPVPLSAGAGSSSALDAVLRVVEPRLPAAAAAARDRARRSPSSPSG